MYSEVVVPGRPSHFTNTVSTGAITVGGTVTLSGVLRNSTDNKPLVGHSVQLQTRVKGTSTWKKVTTVVSSSTGAVRATHKPTRISYYRWVRPASGEWAASTSSSPMSSVKPKLTVKAPTSAKVGSTITVTGVVTPAVTGRTVSLQRYTGGKWKTVGSARIGSGGKVSVKTKLSSVTTYTFRFSLPAATDLSAGTSSSVKVKCVRR
jgi:hypothetical protein